jgi:pimeloyl-ACP methyl ester carboxylesterase
VDLPVAKLITVGGRRVSVYEFGDPEGRPVVALHGVPSSGGNFNFADDAARSRGVRLVAPDRPGVGRSSRYDGWGVADYARSVGPLADTLGLDRFGVWGYSGGGPYAVAIAALLQDRVDRVAVAAGMGQMGVWATADDFEKTDRQMLTMSTKRPRLAAAFLGASGWFARKAPNLAYKSFVKQVSESDRAVIDSMGTPAEILEQFSLAFVEGSRGVVDDYRAIARQWGVDLSAITAPLHIYQGTADSMVPQRHSEELKAQLPHAELTLWPGEGHLATIAHADDILAWLMASD